MITRVRMPAFVLVVCALSGCGVDSTRTLWESRWTGDPPPPGRTCQRALWRTGRTGECVAKIVISPAAATLDAATDERVWRGVLIPAGIAADILALATGKTSGSVDLGWDAASGHDRCQHGW